MIDYLKTLDPEIIKILAIVFATTLTFLSIVSKLSEWITALVFWYRQRSITKHATPTLLLTPSSEEIAKYSVKSKYKYDPAELVYTQRVHSRAEAQKDLERKMNRFRDETRIVLLAISFGISFVVVGVKLWMLAT